MLIPTNRMRRVSVLLITGVMFITAGLAKEDQHNPGAKAAGVSASGAAALDGLDIRFPPCPDQGSSCRISRFCFNSGPFAATILQFTDGAAGNYRKIRLNIRFQNLTTHELILGYHAKTSVLTDDAGSTYFCCKAGDSGPDTSATGIGTNQGGKTDVQFELEAEQSDVATFELWGVRKGKDIPASFHYDVAIDEIDPANPKVILRQHAIFFRDFNSKSRFFAE